MPILGDLYDELLKQPEPEAARIAAALELYVSGSLNVFNHRTNVEPVSYTHLDVYKRQVEYGAWCDLSYYFCEDHILVCTQSDGIGNPYTFASTLRARRAIDTIGEERLKKYWFRVED